MPGLVLRKVLVGCVSCLLMHARSAEGGGVAVGFLQVRQSLLVQLHGVPGQPALDLPIPPLKPAAQKWRDQCHLSSLLTHRLVLAVSLLFFSFFNTQTHLNTHHRPHCWFFLLVCAPRDSRGCQPLIQDKKHKKKKKKYSNVVVLSCSCQSFGSWLNEFRVNMSVHRMDERKHQKPTCNFLSQAKSFIWAPVTTSDPWREGSDYFRARRSLCSFNHKACFSSACFTRSRSVFWSERSFKLKDWPFASLLSTRARKLNIWQCCWWFALTIWFIPEHGRLHLNWLQNKD